MSSMQGTPSKDFTGPDNTTYPNDQTVKFYFRGINAGYSTYHNAEDIHGLLNVTTLIPLKYAIPLLGYIMPVLLLITIISNALMVPVFAQRRMRSPTNLVLLAMSISALLMLLFPVPWHFYMYTLDNHYKPLSSPVACYAYYNMIETFPVLFHTASIWLTLLLVIQRYICVCHPLTAPIWCTVSKVRKAMIWICIIALLHQSTRLFDTAFEHIRFRWRAGLHDGCIRKPADWVRYIIPVDVYYTMYYGFRIMFVLIGPSLALVILNILLLCALRKAEQDRRNLPEESFQSESNILRATNRVTLMLVVVVTIFLVEIPLSVIYILHVMKNLLHLHITGYDTLNATTSFLSCFLNLSLFANIAIYCTMSRQFQKTFKYLFLKGHVIGGKTRYFLMNGPRALTEETAL